MNADCTPGKLCAVCGYHWPDRQALLSDPDVDVIGYQVNFTELQAGFFLFNHSCGTTFALPAEAFLDLHDGPVFAERRTGEADCPGYCLRREILEPCPARCECAFVRDALQAVRNWPKQPAPSGAAAG